MPRKIEISHRTIIFTAFFLLFLWFLYFIRDIITQFFIAILVMVTLDLFVTQLTKLKIPRPLAIVTVYILLFLGLGILITVIAQPLVEQTANFANTLPAYLDAFNIPTFLREGATREITVFIGKMPSQIVKIGISAFSNVINIFTVLTFSFYLLLAREKLGEQLKSFFGSKKAKEIEVFIDKMEKKLGGWARGELVLMFLVGLATFVGLKILGFPFVLPLSLLAGLLEIVPVLGPILAAIPAIIVGLSISPLIGLAAAALSFLIQQLEANILVPKVMEKSLGLSPIITLLAIIIGLKVGGIVGALLSIPVVIVLQIVGKEFLKRE